MKCPLIVPDLIIADDAYLAARLSAIYATPRSYLAVVDGPRMTRPDQQAEVARRCNAAAHVKAKTVFFAGIPEEADLALAARLPPDRISRVANDDDVGRLLASRPAASKEPLSWGPERIGIGLLKALRERRLIVFDADVSLGVGAGVVLDTVDGKANSAEFDIGPATVETGLTQNGRPLVGFELSTAPLQGGVNVGDSTTCTTNIAGCILQ